MGLFLLDYGAGNVQSLANTLERLGRSFQRIKSPSDFDDATVSLQFTHILPIFVHLSCSRV
jgi:imidazoleglycerol phosphate synthase glutamine amidotransferase subunit HisH